MIQFFIKHSKELTIAGALSVLTICYFQQRELTKLRIETQTQTQIIDSLHDEVFIKSVDAGRYELTLDHLKEVNPKIGKEMEEWMSHETE
jgi:hypothetical protein